MSPTIKPWSGARTEMVLLPESVDIGLFDNNISGTTEFSNTTVPPAVVNCALNKSNARSLVWSGVQVVPFCDLNNEPKLGCLSILFSVEPSWNA